ncbi:MAG: hydroxypyruvate isomerase [Rhodocyclaceae bacterium]|jgi:hydroxypyruvate isomerase|nr:hydroxypyruvate isomerase [Rhodocyclaceae bacterium]
MPRFSANLSMLFTEYDFPDRFAAAAAAGFQAVECQFPYDWPADILAERLRRAGLTMVLHNLPAGDWAGGERGIACHPDRVDEFQAGVERALAWAVTLGCPQLNCLAGIQPPGVSDALAHATFVHNLRHAAQRLATAGLRLLIEPINTRDIPGFFLNRSAQAAAVLDAVGADNLFIQYDVYHAQRMEGELAATLARLLPRIGHVQIADNPGRHEPGSGEIHYAWLLRELDRLEYSGWVGCEYVPAGNTVDGLIWRQRLGFDT